MSRAHHSPSLLRGFSYSLFRLPLHPNCTMSLKRKQWMETASPATPTAPSPTTSTKTSPTKPGTPGYGPDGRSGTPGREKKKVKVEVPVVGEFKNAVLGWTRGDVMAKRMGGRFAVLDSIHISTRTNRSPL